MELKPCPFCGEKVAWRKYSLFAKRIAIEKGLPLVPMIRCESCGAMVSFDPIEDPEPNYKKEAAGTLWNMRSERTCHMELRKHGAVYDVFYFDCCCKEYAEYRNNPPDSRISGDVCPYCGAKVVE